MLWAQSQRFFGSFGNQNGSPLPQKKESVVFVWFLLVFFILGFLVVFLFVVFFSCCFSIFLCFFYPACLLFFPVFCQRLRVAASEFTSGPSMSQPWVLLCTIKPHGACGGVAFLRCPLVNQHRHLSTAHTNVNG